MNKYELLEATVHIMQRVLQKHTTTAFVLRSQLITLLDNYPSKNNTPDTHAIRFALVAWIDDILMNSEWSGQSEWCYVSLQQHYFSEHTAGDVFYTKLQQLRQQGLRSVDAVLIYYLCLEMGFQGCYRLANAGMCAVIANDCAEFLNPLLPPGEVPWDQPEDTAILTPSLSVTEGCLLIYGLLAVIFFVLLQFSLQQKIVHSTQLLLTRGGL